MISSPDANARKIIAYGFRNPFRFTIDRQANDIYVDNVGNGTDEEIDRFPLAPSQPYNSGWPCNEGLERNRQFEILELPICQGLYNEAGPTSQPFFYYTHSTGVAPGDPCPHESGNAITGLSF